MNYILIGLVCVGFIQAIYTLVSLLSKIKRASKDKCNWQASKAQWIIHGIGIVLLLSASVVFLVEDSIAWIFFFCLFCNQIIDFIEKGIKINEI